MSDDSAPMQITFRVPYAYDSIDPEDIIGIPLYDDQPIDERIKVGEVVDTNGSDGGIECVATVDATEALRAEQLQMGIVPETIDCTITVGDVDDE
jgi:hypothetical protein